MPTLIIYFLALFLELIFLGGFAVIIFSLIYSTLKGAPYVPTSTRQLDLILEKAKLKKNQVFLELGCGDGRVVRTAVKKYHVKGIGVEINPLLFFWAKLLAKFKKTNIHFSRLDIESQNLPGADIIYIFLMPKLIEKISPELLKQLEKGTLIISHGFKIKALSRYQRFKLFQKPFPTYFYKLT